MYYFPCIGGNYTKGLRFLLKIGMERPLLEGYEPA